MADIAEPVAVHDVFVEGVAQIARLPGDCFRFTLFATRDYGDGQPPERIVVAQLIWPRAALDLAIKQALAAEQGLPFVDGQTVGMVAH